MTLSNKSLTEMTDDELVQAYAHWDFQVRHASSWGSTMAHAETQMLAVATEQALRRRSAKP